MPGGRRQRPHRAVRSAYQVPPQETTDDEEEEVLVRGSSSRGSQPPSGRRQATRRLPFSSSQGGTTSRDDERGGGDDDDDDDDDDGDDAPTPGETASTSSGVAKVYSRGPTQLPRVRPQFHQCPVITPVGQTSWKIVSGAGQARHINGIQGLLIKEYYPGLVNVNGEMKVPTKWSHFYLVEEGGETIAAKIKREFWDFFTCEEGKAAQAARVQEAVCKDRLKDLYHEARIQAIRDFHANVLGENIKKPQIRQRMNSREADLTQAQYEQVCPSWCDNHRECWTEIVRMWRTDEAYARRADRQGRRAQMRGVSHHQGNQPLPQFTTRWTQTHGGQEINEYTAYLLSHKGKATDPNNVYNPEDGPDAYTNPTAYEKATEYTVAARQRYGETFDPTAEPLDTDLLQRLGHGKQHGRYYMAHSALDPSQVPTLTQVRSTPTSSSDIPVAPRRQSASQAQMEAKMEERIATLHAQMMAQQMAYQQSLQQHYNTQMQNMASFFQSMQTSGASTPPPLPMFAPPPPPPEFFPVPAPVAPGGTPVQSAGSNPSPGGPGHQMMSYPPPAPYPPYPPPRGPPPTYSWPPVRGGWQYSQAPQFGLPWENPRGSGGGADDETGDGATS